MRRAAEIAVFLGLSAAVHAGVVAGFGDASGGPQGQGAGGADRMTLQAAPESLSSLAERWTEAPAAAPEPAALQAPSLPAALPVPSSETAAPRVALPRLSEPAAAETAPPLPETAPALARPVPSLSPGAPSLPMPGAAPAVPDRAETAPLNRRPPALAAPEAPADPHVTVEAPPPPGSTALATAVSPRPTERPTGGPSEPPPRPTAQPPASAPPSAPQQARVAAGSGEGAAQGAAPSASPAWPALSAAERESLTSQWGAQINARIARAQPRVRGSGQVVLALQVARSGALTGLSVARSSGDPALDEAALSAVRRAGRFPAAPDGLTDATYAFSLPVRFR